MWLFNFLVNATTSALQLLSSSSSSALHHPSPDISLSNLLPFASVGHQTHPLSTCKFLDVIFLPCSWSSWVPFCCSGPLFRCLLGPSIIIYPHQMARPFHFCLATSSAMSMTFVFCLIHLFVFRSCPAFSSPSFFDQSLNTPWSPH